MKSTVLLLLFSHAASAANHTLEYVFTATSGVNSSMTVMGTSSVDGTQIGRYDNSSGSWKSETQLAWMEGLSAEDSPFWENQTQLQLNYLTDIMDSKQQSDQTAENHTVQLIASCTLDNQTQEVNGTQKYSYNGTDFIYFDLETQTWNTRRREAHVIRFRWNWNSTVIKLTHYFLTQICPQWLKDNWDSLDHTAEEPAEMVHHNTTQWGVLGLLAVILIGLIGFIGLKWERESDDPLDSSTESGAEESETPLMEGGAKSQSE